MRKLVIALVMLVAVPSNAAANTVLETVDSNGDGWVDTWGLDSDGDGVMDRLGMDVDGNGYYELDVLMASPNQVRAMFVDTNNSLHYDVCVVPIYSNGVQTGVALYRDFNADGRWEAGGYDNNNDGRWDSILIDSNGDGTGDEWAANVMPAGLSIADHMRRHLAGVKAFSNLVAGNVPIFGPLAWPVGG